MDDTVPIRHPLGRCQTKPKVFQNYRTLLGWETLPNVYRPAVIAHAGEIVHGDELAADVAETGRATASVIIHHEKGVMNALKTTVNAAQEIVREASGQNRVPADYSNLTFGIN
jgi:altronate dehydratase large subunit